METLTKLLQQLSGRFRQLDEPGDRPDRAEASPADEGSTASPARSLLALVQADALAIFRKSGLPDVPGTYGFDPEQGQWSRLDAVATPTERWVHVLNHPPENGWRYAGLSQIGRKECPGDPVVALAADLLEQVSTSLARLDGESTGDAAGRHDLEIAFELTLTWMRLQEAVTLPVLDSGPEPVPTRSRKTPVKARSIPVATAKKRKRPNA